MHQGFFDPDICTPPVSDIAGTDQITEFLNSDGPAFAFVSLSEAQQLLTDFPSAGAILSIDGTPPDDPALADNFIFSFPLIQYYDAAQVRNSQTIDYLCALLRDDAQDALEKVGGIGVARRCRMFVLAIDPDEWGVKWTDWLPWIELG